MRLASQQSGRRIRRGFTLVEMLVVVALLVLMMTILASIFQVATGSISVSRTIQELDNNLKFLDMTIRSDLQGITAKMTPPNDPAQKRGYFEYGENAPADLQGEDTDDYLAMTVKAPEGQPFRGRVWVPSTNPNRPKLDPTIVTSQFAEVIYFLRNGNLYRRVLLVAPTRNGSLTREFPLPAQGAVGSGTYPPNMFNKQVVSWLAVNDISAHPATGPAFIAGLPNYTPVANDLGDLTNRENRFARQRFGNDYWNDTQLIHGVRDGIIDDGNHDGIPDYWPTLTPSQVQQASMNQPGVIGGLMNEDSASMPQSMPQGATLASYARAPLTRDLYCFPFVFPGMYTVPETSSLATNGNSLGWLHALDSRAVAGYVPSGPILNHGPLEFGDSLPIPDPSVAGRPGFQSWLGFPTWRETASPFWCDPADSITTGSAAPVAFSAGQQPPGLQAWDQSTTPFLNNNPANLLPPLGYAPSAHGAPYESDGVGNGTATTFTGPANAWEDDLIMTGVRSFDVKAYDPTSAIYNLPTSNIYYSAGYYDLGYASTDFARVGNSTLVNGDPNPLKNPNGYGISPLPSAIQDSNYNPIGFGHEGRMPPLTNDNRADPQRMSIATGNKDANGNPVPPFFMLNNIGDNTTGSFAPQRLRRVWDSWSTDYTNAPAVDIINLRGSTFHSYPLDRPIYPSYPPPYPQPLRGIQIQIRVADPKNERVKVLTIRQDFSDKLQ